MTIYRLSNTLAVSKKGDYFFVFVTSSNGDININKKPNIMTNTKLLLIVLVAGLLPFAAEAQQGVISGTITDETTGDPLFGAEVLVVEEGWGTTTGAEGQYSLEEIPAGTYTLQVAFLGYATETRVVSLEPDEEVTVNFELSEEWLGMDEVVITGTAGETQRRALGHTVSRVDASDIAERTSSSTISELLQGQAPGMTMIPGSGTVGASSNIRIRGASSLSANNQPVWYVDGIRFSSGGQGHFGVYGQNTSALDAINPADIESIEVISGPSAATIYGADAASGVINIITKQGSMGEPTFRWNASVERGALSWPTDWRPTNYTEVTQERLDNPDVWPALQGMQVGDFYEHVPMDDDTDALRNGILERYTLSVRGGGENYAFYLSGARDEEEGVFMNNYQDRTSLRGNFDFYPLEQLNFSINAAYSQNELGMVPNDNIYYGIIISSWLAVPGRQYPEPGDLGYLTISPEYYNQYQNITEANRYTLGTTINYRPTDWFRNRLRIGIDSNVRTANEFYPPFQDVAPFGGAVADGYRAQARPQTTVYTLDYGGSMDYELAEGITSQFSFGAQYDVNIYENIMTTGRDYGTEHITLVGAGAETSGSESYSETRTLGLYLEEQIGYRDRIYLIGGLRMDNSSVFGDEIESVFYPKGSLSYVISDEDFFEVDPVEELRLRLAYGQAGNIPGPFDAMRTWTVTTTTQEDGTSTPALQYSSFGNPELEPERSTELEAGFDLSMYFDRVNMEFTYYNIRTKDALISMDVPGSSGWHGTRMENIGEIKNTGFELQLSLIPVQTPDFFWSNTFSLSTNDNELVRFAEDRDRQIFGIYAPVQRFQEGKPLGAFWGQPAEVDEDGVASLTGEDVYKGPSVPTHELRYAVDLTLFGNLTMYALLDYQGGHYQFNVKDWRRDRGGISWKVNDPEADPDEVAKRRLWNQNALHIEEADFLKLRQLSMGYSMPHQWIDRLGVDSAEIRFTARNVAILWTNYRGHDPELNFHGDADFSRVDSWTAPNFRRVTASLNFSF